MGQTFGVTLRTKIIILYSLLTAVSAGLFFYLYPAADQEAIRRLERQTRLQGLCLIAERIFWADQYLFHHMDAPNDSLPEMLPDGTDINLFQTWPTGFELPETANFGLWLDIEKQNLLWFSTGQKKFRAAVSLNEISATAGLRLSLISASEVQQAEKAGPAEEIKLSCSYQRLIRIYPLPGAEAYLSKFPIPAVNGDLVFLRIDYLPPTPPAPRPVNLMYLLVFAWLGLVVFIGIFYIAHVVTRPLHHLAGRSHKILAGLPIERLPVEALDESASLAIALNTLLDHVRQTQRDGENQVRFRTAELEAANDKLRRYTENLEQMVVKRLKEIRTKDSALMQAGKLASLGEMAAGIAHELNQPLNVIKISVTGLMRLISRHDQIDYEFIDTELKLVFKQITRLQKVIEQMKMYTRKPLPENLRPESLNLAVENCLLIFGQQLVNGGMEIRLDLDPDLPLVLMDIIQAEQIIVNLVYNARDALDARMNREPEFSAAEITIRTRTQPGQVVLEIYDNGIGMDEETQKFIFEPFFTKDKKGGTGLGLSITSSLVRNMFGKIELDSEKGQGTCFRVILPRNSSAEMEGQEI